MKKLLQLFMLLFALEQVASAGFFSSFLGSSSSISHTPQSNETEVSPDVVIKLTYGEDVYHSSLSRNNIILTRLSNGERVDGSISYTSADKSIAFTPFAPLEYGKYHIKYKDIVKKSTGFFFFKYYTFDKVEFDFSVSQSIKNISFNLEDMELNVEDTTTISVVALYEDNTTKDITENVEWIIGDGSLLSIQNGIIKPIKEGTTTLQAKYSNKTTKEVKLTLFKEISGYRLPPEPDPQINNSTLLGIDVNNNGVRDDVERKIIETYREPIKITYMFKTAQIGQEILEDPQGAFKEHSDKMDRLDDCGMYLDNLNISFDILQSLKFYNNNMYNTKARVRAYLDYNLALSGGVYGSSPADWVAASCDFDVDAMLGARK